jgi:hypothetical protein
VVTSFLNRRGHSVPHLRRYDEPGLLQEVEKRLGSSIPSLSEDLSLPSELQARMAGGSGGGMRAPSSLALVHVCQNPQGFGIPGPGSTRADALSMRYCALSKAAVWRCLVCVRVVSVLVA